MGVGVGVGVGVGRGNLAQRGNGGSRGRSVEARMLCVVVCVVWCVVCVWARAMARGDWGRCEERPRTSVSASRLPRFWSEKIDEGAAPCSKLNVACPRDRPPK